jgi:hypothetical protein
MDCTINGYKPSTTAPLPSSPQGRDSDHDAEVAGDSVFIVIWKPLFSVCRACDNTYHVIAL